MNGTIRLGRIAGVPVGVSWTWLPLFALFLWSLSEHVFPQTNPGLGDGTYFVMGVAATLLFFASLLLHELGHAVVARREGMTIDGITLWLLGGVARFGGAFPSAGAELRIAIAGPVVSAVIGLVSLGFAWLTRSTAAVDGVVAWLGYINLLLVVFNLVPALPLDGGRVLRAALWLARGDFGWATRIAAIIARGFAVVMIGVGLGALFAAEAFSGLWLALIGLFLLGAARAEDQFAADCEALDGLVVGDLMRRQVGLLDRTPPLHAAIVFEEGDPAPEAVSALRRSGSDSAAVVDAGRLVGVLAVSDVDRALRLGPRRWSRVHRLQGPRTGQAA